MSIHRVPTDVFGHTLMISSWFLIVKSFLVCLSLRRPVFLPIATLAKFQWQRAWVSHAVQDARFLSILAKGFRVLTNNSVSYFESAESQSLTKLVVALAISNSAPLYPFLESRSMFFVLWSISINKIKKYLMYFSEYGSPLVLLRIWQCRFITLQILKVESVV